MLRQTPAERLVSSNASAASFSEGLSNEASRVMRSSASGSARLSWVKLPLDTRRKPPVATSWLWRSFNSLCIDKSLSSCLPAACRRGLIHLYLRVLALRRVVQNLIPECWWYVWHHPAHGANANRSHALCLTSQAGPTPVSAWAQVKALPIPMLHRDHLAILYHGLLPGCK